MKLAERFVRTSRARRSFTRRTSSTYSNGNASDNESEGMNGLFIFSFCRSVKPVKSCNIFDC